MEAASPIGGHWGIVGGGMLGLTVAHRLAQRGAKVALFEAAPALGGLAGAWSLGDVVWDRHYHVTMLSDRHLRVLLAELGLEESMDWVETRTGCYTAGTLYSVSNTIEFLRFPPLGFLDKLRLGATIFAGSRVRNWERLENIPVEEWLIHWSGRSTYEKFWKPLLVSKLGDSYRESSAAFIWATIQRLYAARRSGLKKEMFGYVPGGYSRVLARFAEVLEQEGVTLHLATPVTRIESSGEAVQLTSGDGLVHRFDEVVVTANASLARQLIVGLTPAERERLEGVRYQGIVCASLLLDRPLSPYYVTNITDAVPFTAVVEMSALVDRGQFGGRSLVYVPKYCTAADPLMSMDDKDVGEVFLAALEGMYPDFSREQVECFRVSRVREVFAIPTLGYSRTVPSFSTSVQGVHLVTSAQIVNGTLNVNESVQLAERAVESFATPTASALAGLSGVPAAPVAHGEPDRRDVRPIAGLSIDLDNLWSYLKTHGDPRWEQFPSFLDVVIPRVIAFTRERNLPMTWFVVGRDAASAANADLLPLIAAEGHEIGNHSFLHEPWLHRYGAAKVERDIRSAEEAIEAATGVRPEGFRAPGYSLSSDVLDVLQRRGYRYDASTLPTFIGPLARRYFLRTVALDSSQLEERQDLYGPWQEGLRPLKPYWFRANGGRVLEVPTTTAPIVRTPIHMSYLLYLSELSPRLARGYFRSALRLCRLTGVSPSLLLHSHDFLGAEDVEDMSFFPGLKQPSEVKVRWMGAFVDCLLRSHRGVTLGEFAELASGRNLSHRQPRFHYARLDDGRGDGVMTS